MKFKIGQLVLVDTVGGLVRPARIEGIDEWARRARVLFIGTWSRQDDVGLGDMALPGEDITAARRERSRLGWRYVEGGISNDMGGGATRPAPNPDYAATGSRERD